MPEYKDAFKNIGGTTKRTKKFLLAKRQQSKHEIIKLKNKLAEAGDVAPWWSTSLVCRRPGFMPSKAKRETETETKSN